MLKGIQNANLKNKTVVVRANLDLPMSDGEISDNTRLKALLPTINLLIENKCKIIIIGHMGRPNGEYKESLSLMNARFELGHLLEKTIKFANIEACANSIKFMEPSEILMLENLRFHKGEESDSVEERMEMLKPLIELCDVYVNDCFGVSRKHASVYELPLNSKESYAGLSLINEIEQLGKLRDNVESPYVAVIGGAKIDTKQPILLSLTQKVDMLLIGGAMAIPFLKAQGKKVGNHIISDLELENAKEILKTADKNNCEIVLPLDHVVADEFSESSKPHTTDDSNIPENKLALDIGPQTCKKFHEYLKDAKTILWNGPMGVVEWENFRQGTMCVGDFIAHQAEKEVFTVAGGGDTLGAINLLKLQRKRFNHISVGGGMMLDFLAGKEFEVIDILKS